MSTEKQQLHGVVFPRARTGTAAHGTRAGRRGRCAAIGRPVGARAAEQETDWRVGLSRALPSAGRGGTRRAGGGAGDRARRARVAARADAGGGPDGEQRVGGVRPDRPDRRSTRPRSRGRRAGAGADAALPRRAAARRRAPRGGSTRGSAAGVARAVAGRGGPSGAGQPGVAAARRPHRRGARRRRRDGAAAVAAALGRPGRRGRPAPARSSGSACSDRPRREPGTLLVPAARTAPTPDLERRAGVDLLADAPAVAGWLGELRRPAGRWATTCTPTVPPTSGCRWRSTRSPRGCTARPRRRGAGVPGHPDRRVRRARRGRGAGAPRGYDGRSGTGEAARPAAARPSAAGRLLRRAYVRRRRPRHQRQPGAAAGARTTPWPSGCSGGGRPSPATPARRSR